MDPFCKYSKKRVKEVNDRDKTSGKNWVLIKRKIQPTWVLAPPWKVAN